MFTILGNKLSNRRYGTITCSEPMKTITPTGEIEEKCFAKEGDDVTWRKEGKSASRDRRVINNMSINNDNAFLYYSS